MSFIHNNQCGNDWCHRCFYGLNCYKEKCKCCKKYNQKLRNFLINKNGKEKK